jgi:hypothetical protein
MAGEKLVGATGPRGVPRLGLGVRSLASNGRCISARYGGVHNLPRLWKAIANNSDCHEHSVASTLCMCTLNHVAKTL